MAGKEVQQALECLTESEKCRMLCVLLYSKLPTSAFNFDIATEAFGATNKSSMVRMYSAAQQKFWEKNPGEKQKRDELGNKYGKYKNGPGDHDDNDDGYTGITHGSLASQGIAASSSDPTSKLRPKAESAEVQDRDEVAAGKVQKKRAKATNSAEKSPRKRRKVLSSAHVKDEDDQAEEPEQFPNIVV